MSACCPFGHIDEKVPCRDAPTRAVETDTWRRNVTASLEPQARDPPSGRIWRLAHPSASRALPADLYGRRGGRQRRGLHVGAGSASQTVSGIRAARRHSLVVSLASFRARRCPSSSRDCRTRRGPLLVMLPEMRAALPARVTARIMVSAIMSLIVCYLNAYGLWSVP